MDEIDAALDYRNVAIIANYIKAKTRNAQFIIISLRNHMFELADQVGGCYHMLVDQVGGFRPAQQHREAIQTIISSRRGGRAFTTSCLAHGISIFSLQVVGIFKTYDNSDHIVMENRPEDENRRIAEMAILRNRTQQAQGVLKNPTQEEGEGGGEEENQQDPPQPHPHPQFGSFPQGGGSFVSAPGPGPVGRAGGPGPPAHQGTTPAPQQGTLAFQQGKVAEGTPEIDIYNQKRGAGRGTPMSEIARLGPMNTPMLEGTPEVHDDLPSGQDLGSPVFGASMAPMEGVESAAFGGASVGSMEGVESAAFGASMGSREGVESAGAGGAPAVEEKSLKRKRSSAQKGRASAVLTPDVVFD